MKARVRALLPREVKPHRILGGPLRGQSIVTSWHDYPRAILGRTEDSLIRLLRSEVKGGQTWLDVGAQYGYTALACGKAGKVYAFEPVEATAAALEKTVKVNSLSNVRVVRLGLSDHEGEVEVGLFKGMADHMMDGGERVTIRLAPLDKLWPDLDGGPIHGVKLDIQGAEVQAIRGMRGLLGEHRPLLILETHAGIDVSALRTLLAELGYDQGEPVESGVPAYTPDHSMLFRPI